MSEAGGRRQEAEDRGQMPRVAKYERHEAGGKWMIVGSKRRPAPATLPDVIVGNVGKHYTHCSDDACIAYQQT
jgi:hypothetical protein